MIMMTAVHLWLLALSPKAVLQFFLKRLPAGEECHTLKQGKYCLWLNQCHLHMQDKTNPHQREGSPPEALSCPFQAIALLLNDPLTIFTLPERTKHAITLCAEGGNSTGMFGLSMRV